MRTQRRARGPGPELAEGSQTPNHILFSRPLWVRAWGTSVCASERVWVGESTRVTRAARACAAASQGSAGRARATGRTVVGHSRTLTNYKYTHAPVTWARGKEEFLRGGVHIKSTSFAQGCVCVASGSCVRPACRSIPGGSGGRRGRHEETLFVCPQWGRACFGRAERICAQGSGAAQ